MDWVSSFFRSQKCLQLGPWSYLTKEDPEITVANRKKSNVLMSCAKLDQ